MRCAFTSAPSVAQPWLPWVTSGALSEFMAFSTVAVRSLKLLNWILTVTFGNCFSYAGTMDFIRSCSPWSAQTLSVTLPSAFTCAGVTGAVIVSDTVVLSLVLPPGAEQPARATAVAAIAAPAARRVRVRRGRRRSRVKDNIVSPLWGGSGDRGGSG